MSDATSAATAPEAPATEAAPDNSTPVLETDFRARAAKVLEDANAEAPAVVAPVAVVKPGTVAPPAKAEEKPPEDAWSTKFAQLTEGQKRLQAEREASKAELRAEREALRRESQENDEIRKAKASGSPVKVLMAHGWSYEDATKEVLGQPLSGQKEVTKEAPKVDPELSALKEEVAALRKERQEETYRGAVATFRSGLVKAAEAGGEKYELVRATESYDDAVQWVLAYHQKHGVLPGENEAQAMEEALAHIERREEERLLRPAVLTSTKLRSRLQPAGEVPKPAAARPQATSAKSPPSSLSNSLAATAPPRTAPPEPTSREEYVAAAAALLAGDAG